MTDTPSSSDRSYRQSLNKALHVSCILTGALDDDLGIKKPTTTTKLGAKHLAENQAALHATLSDRLQHAVCSWDHLASFQLNQNAEIATGDLALFLLSRIHSCLVEKKKDVASRVAVHDERTPALKHKGIQPKEEVGLGIKHVKLVTTLQSLSSRWALAKRIKAYDEALFKLAPKGFGKAQDKTASTFKLTEQNRFEEVDEEREVQQRANARLAFNAARQDLASVVDRWASILVAQGSGSATALGGPVSASTDVVTVMLRVGIVDYLSSLLRLGFGPNVNPAASQPNRTAPTKDKIQKRAAAATTQLLRFLSTHSAMSALSSVIAHSDAKLAAPSFVKAVSSRLLSAQLLRPDGVRSLFIITFGRADLADAAAELQDADGQRQTQNSTAEPGSNSLKRFEQCARLLLTTPQGMPLDVYMPIILPNILDILAPNLDPKSNITPPPQEQMRAAGFVLTRLSERHPQLFAKAMHDRVYSNFRPSLPSLGTNMGTEHASVVVTSVEELDSAVSVLSSFLLFSEPSPTFFTVLFEPILPQLLTLYNLLHSPKQGNGKGKVRSHEAGTQRDRLKVEVANFLKTWIRLVDAKHGAKSLVEGVQAAETGIGYHPAASNSDDDGFALFWSEQDDGITIRYGQPPTSSEQDLSSLLKDLSLAALAKQISAGNDDQVDLSKIAPDLSARLGLQPDPRLVATLLKGADRKDLARLLLPSVLNIYMAQKSASRVKIVSQDGGVGSQTRSVLYLQLILQLFDAFGPDLLQGDLQAMLAFVDFSLSSPSQRQAPPQHDSGSKEKKVQVKEEMPFISAKGSAAQSKASSLFNIAADNAQETALAEAKQEEPIEEEEEEEEEEELLTTALSLLLCLLESDPTLSAESQPMLLVISDKIESLLDSTSPEIRSLAKEAKLVLLARRTAHLSPTPSTPAPSTSTTTETSSRSLRYSQAQSTYQEALKLLQDPILPVRAHGLVLLRRLVSDDPKSGGQNVGELDPALMPAILDIFLHAVQDEESYLYLNAVQGLGALAVSGGGQTIARLVGIYIDRDDRLLSQGMPAGGVEKRLRVGEALLQVVQRCGEAMSVHLDGVVPPLLAKLGDRRLPNVLRSSFVSILGTMVEAVPLAMASKGYAGRLAEVCVEIVVIEMVRSPKLGGKGVKMKVQGQRITDADEEEKVAEQQKKLDSATITDPKVAHLRRAAMLLLTLLVRGTQLQLQDQQHNEGGFAEKLSALRLPGGGMLPSISTADESAAVGNGGKRRLEKKDLLFPPKMLQRLKQVAAYLVANDSDAILRTHAYDCLQHVEALLLELVSTDVGLLF
ncbi:hypothetical protein NDA17_001179 [Ustilago hordei]|nr:hypothetical protein NDA17_001179 [Ustilago hordei]